MQSEQVWEEDSMDIGEPAALLESSPAEEDLFQLCTSLSETSFIASFSQMKAWQTYSSLFL